MSAENLRWRGSRPDVDIQCTHVREAIWSYNHSWEYVDAVMEKAADFVGA